MLRLDLGSGGKPSPGYTTVDAYADADIRCDMTELDQWFAPESITAIRTSHSFEHIRRKQVPGVLASIFRILAPGGELWIDVPDAAEVGRELYEAEKRGDEKARDWWLTVSYGLQTTPGEYHYNGFTMTSLTQLIESTGFKIVSTAREESHGGPAIQVLAEKPR